MESRNLDDRRLLGRSGARARRRARHQRDDRVASSSGAATATRRGRARSSRVRCPATIRSCSATCAAAVEAIGAAVARGARICVHGDYDADGICATALAVLLLRELGADPEWHLPSRFEEGYGLNGETLARLAGDGVELRADGGLRHHRRRRGRRGEAARARDRRHRPPPARRDASRTAPSSPR